MSPTALACDSIRIPIAGKIGLLIWGPRVSNPESLTTHAYLPAGWRFQSGDANAVIRYDQAALERGLHALWIDELKTISWELDPGEDDPPMFKVRCSLEDSLAASGWSVVRTRRSLRGSMCFVNYLGTAWLEVRRNGFPFGERLRFDVVTRKIDFETEYRAIVEGIAAECQQLLLEWSSPTSVSIIVDPEKQAQILLEQFSFLSHMLGSERVDLFLEAIQRQPHSRLERERRWQPSTSADSRLFMRDPLRFGRDWRAAAPSDRGMAKGFNAGEILEERQFETFDTPPNQFVKFALRQFHSLCDEIVASLEEEQGAAWLEARQMRGSLDALLGLPFFEEVGELRRMPFESQALQKREGYRDILLAWLMLDAAAQIDWPGREDAYDGTNRDVATLYEYWLYFVLMRVLKKDLGMESGEPPEEDDDTRPFCSTVKDKMRINLRAGRESLCRFTWRVPNGDTLRIHFFYNRLFSRSKVDCRGTYSKGLRPDFTLVIIPGEIDESNWSKAEQRAESEGRIAYLHFDAKYRVEKLAEVFGEGEVESDADKREAKATGTFKNADLYKMHTYTEAIRRTIGSYVLYPGDDPMNQTPNNGGSFNRFERYHEIVPGIGAFALKPSKAGADEEPMGLPFLITFLRDILNHQLSRFTQSYRISYWTEDTVKEAPVESYGSDGIPHLVATPDALVVLGFMPKDLAADFEDRKYFYCRAIEEDGPVDIDIAAAAGATLLGWTAPHVGDRLSYPWIATIESCRLLPKPALEEVIGRETSTESPYYLYFKLTDIRPFSRLNLNPIIPANSYKARSVKWKAIATQPVASE